MKKIASSNQRDTGQAEPAPNLSCSTDNPIILLKSEYPTGSESGYKYNEDSIYLADYVSVRNGDNICDLGTGCGIIPIYLAHYKNPSTILGIEIQNKLSNIASENIRNNSLSNKISIINDDFREYAGKQNTPKFDVVVSNPPYYKLNSGRVNPDNEKLIARHEIKCDLDELAYTVNRLLKNGGKFYSVYLTSRMPDYFGSLKKNGIVPKSIRLVYPDLESESWIFLSKSVKGANDGLCVDKPLIIRNLNGKRTREATKILSRLRSLL